MPKGYFLVNSRSLIRRPTRFYGATVPDIISAHGGRILVRGGEPQPLRWRYAATSLHYCRVRQPRDCEDLLFLRRISVGAAVQVKLQHQQWLHVPADRSGIGIRPSVQRQTHFEAGLLASPRQRSLRLIRPARMPSSTNTSLPIMKTSTPPPQSLTKATPLITA